MTRDARDTAAEDAAFPLEVFRQHLREARASARAAMRDFRTLPPQSVKARVAARARHIEYNNAARMALRGLRAASDEPAHVFALGERFRQNFASTRNPLHAWAAVLIYTKWRTPDGMAHVPQWCADFIHEVARNLTVFDEDNQPTAPQVAAAVGIIRQGYNAAARLDADTDTFFSAERAAKLQAVGYPADQARAAAFGDRITDSRTLRRTAKRALPKGG